MKPEFVKIGDTKYKINSDFRVALECDRIVRDNSISEYEKALAIIYKLFGDEGLDNPDDYEKLLELAQKFLLAGREPTTSSNTEPDMDYEQDRGKIKASFFSVYKLEDIYSIDYMHWWDFFDYLNGLTEDCVLNYARYVRNYDISHITDPKERKEWLDRKKEFALKTEKSELTEREKSSASKFMELAKIS